MTAPPSPRPLSLLESPLARRWLIYFSILAYGWCAMSGVVFILSLAFLADSGRIDGAYFRNLTEVAKLLFVWPLLVAAILSGLAAGLHGYVARFAGRMIKKPAPLSDPIQEDVMNMPGKAPCPKETSPPIGRFLPTFFIFAACLVSMILGSLIVVGNAPRSLIEKGPGITIITSSIFLLPMVGIPSVILLRTLLRCREPNRRPR